MSTFTDIEVNQASDVYLIINHKVNDSPLPPLSAAKYIVFDRSGTPLVTKTLGAGLEYSAGAVTVHITETDSAGLRGGYNHECVVRDLDDNDIFILTGKIKFNKTTARIQ